MLGHRLRHLLHWLGGTAALGPALSHSDMDLIRRIRAARITYLSSEKCAAIARTCRRIEEAGLHGAFLEAGCALGGSAVLIASMKRQERPFRIYDVFGMIPAPTADDTTDVHQRYRTIVEGQSQGIDGDPYYGYVENLLDVVTANLAAFGVDLEAQRVTLIRGLLQDTMHLDKPVAMAHVDVDWFDPVRTCLDRIFPRLVVGGSIILDDYNDWGGCRKAADAFIAVNRRKLQLDQSARSLVITRRSR